MYNYLQTSKIHITNVCLSNHEGLTRTSGRILGFREKFVIGFTPLLISYITMLIYSICLVSRDGIAELQTSTQQKNNVDQAPGNKG